MPADRQVHVHRRPGARRLARGDAHRAAKRGDAVADVREPAAVADAEETAPRPHPSSLIDTRRRPSDRASATVARVACACFAVFASASRTT